MKQVAEAQGIEAVTKAIEKAANNPMLVQLKQQEVDKARNALWDGHYPLYVIGSNANTWVGLGSPAPAPVQATVATAPAAVK